MDYRGTGFPEVERGGRYGANLRDKAKGPEADLYRAAEARAARSARFEPQKPIQGLKQPPRRMPGI